MENSTYTADNTTDTADDPASEVTNTTDTADDPTSEVTNTTDTTADDPTASDATNTTETADATTSDTTNTTNTTTDIPTDVCQDELKSANACVSQSPDECSCIPSLDTFMTSFPGELDTTFQDIMNNSGGQEEAAVCKDAEKSVCDFIQEKSSCCCQAETLSYTTCYVSAMVASAFTDAPPCARSVRCALQVLPSDADMADQQKNQRLMIYAIVASIIGTLLCCLCYCCFSVRRRRIIIREKNSRQALEINVVCNTENNTTETTRETKESSTKKTTKIDRKVSKKVKKDETDDESFNWDDYNPKRRGDDEDNDIEKGQTSPRKKDKKPSSERTLELREKRRRIESWNEMEKEKRRSSRSLCSTSSSTVSSHEGRKKKKTTKKKSRSKRSDPEQSIRKARTVLETVQAAQSEGAATKVLVVPALREVIELLEEEKWKLEHRQKSIEEEKLRLQIEVDASKAKVDALNDQQNKTAVELQKAIVNKELIRSNSMKDLAEAEPSALKADLKHLTKERNEMMRLLARLKQAEKELGQTLETSRETVGALQTKMKRTGSQLALAEISKVNEQKQIVQAQNDLVELESSRREVRQSDQEEEDYSDMDGDAHYDAQGEPYGNDQDYYHPNEYGGYDDDRYGEEYEDGDYEPEGYNVIVVDEDGQYIEEGYVVYDDEIDQQLRGAYHVQMGHYP